MKHSISNFPVGAEWKGTTKDGKLAYIRLQQRYPTHEMWVYGYMHSDGSGAIFDWATSYALAKKNHFVSCKFKRVKDE